MTPKLRRPLAAVAALTAAAALTGTSTAFLASSSGTEGDAGTGDVELGGTAASTPLVADGGGLRAGATRTGFTKIVNDGSVPAVLYARLRLPAVRPADGEAPAPRLTDVLEVAVDECATVAADAAAETADCSAATPVAAPTGLASLGRLQLGLMEPGAVRVFRTRLTWPADADSSLLYGASESFALRWTLRTQASTTEDE